MSIDAINWVFEIQDLSPSEKLVLLSLANRANDKSHLAWPSWARLMRDTSLSRKSIHRLLESLIKKGFLMKNGEKVRQVYVYKLCGVLSKEELSKLKAINKKLSTTSVTMTPVSQRHQCHHDTPTSVTMTRVPVSPRHLEPSVESKKESKGEDSIFLPIKTQIQNQLMKHELEATDDIIAQIEFYIDSKPEQPEEQTIRVAVNLHKKGQWRIPNGYNGITSKSIAQKEEAYIRKEETQYQQDGKAYRNILAQLPTKDIEKPQLEEQASEKKESEKSDVAKSAIRNLVLTLNPKYRFSDA